MSKLLNIIFTTIVSTLISIVILLCLSLMKGMSVDWNDFVYALVVLFFQMFIPFLIFVFICDKLLQFMIKGLKFRFVNKFILTFFLFTICTFVATLFWTIGDIVVDGGARNLSHYLNEFSLFLFFGPIAGIISFLIGDRKNLFEL
jgi:hypothetical protein